MRGVRLAVLEEWGKIMKVAIYARVSKERCNDCGKPREACICSDFRGQDTENQLIELRQFVAQSGWTVTKEYIDHESAKSGDRAQFQVLLADAGKRKFKGVLVWALDRFTREGIEETFAYIRKLKDSGVDFVSYTEAHFRTTGPAGELMLAIAAWIAKQERIRIGERTRAGLATARRNGKRLGRPVVAFDSAAVMRMHGEGMGVARIAKELGGVSRETLRRLIVKNAPAPATEEPAESRPPVAAGLAPISLQRENHWSTM